LANSFEVVEVVEVEVVKLEVMGVVEMLSSTSKFLLSVSSFNSSTPLLLQLLLWLSRSTLLLCISSSILAPPLFDFVDLRTRYFPLTYQDNAETKQRKKEYNRKGQRLEGFQMYQDNMATPLPASENQAEKELRRFLSTEETHRSARRAHLTIMTKVRKPSNKNIEVRKCAKAVHDFPS
jgi:hypothetical protein